MDYRQKDADKFKICNKLLSRGVKGSSSYHYSKNGIGSIKADMVNTGVYVSSDVVGISVNGNRKGSKLVNMAQLKKIMTAGATVVKDNSIHTARVFNTGERHVSKMLLKNNYYCQQDNKTRSVWRKFPSTIIVKTEQLTPKTARFKSERSPFGRYLFINATVKSGLKMFAPTWDMVRGVQSHKLTIQQYTAKYLTMMRESFKINHTAWLELLKFEEIKIACYCPDGKFCHRHLLAECFVQFFTKQGLNARVA